MRTSRSFSCTALLLLCIYPIVLRGDVTSDLAAVQKEFFEWHEQRAPSFSTAAGGTKYNDRVADLSIDVLDSDLVAIQQFINTTLGIDRSQLRQQHQYSYDVFMDTLNTFVSNYDWRYYGPLNPISFLEGFYLDFDSFVASTPLDTKEDFANYTARLEAWPTQIDQIMTRMDKAIQMGTTYHNVSMRAVPGQISAVVSTPPQDSVLYRPFSTKLDTLDISQTEREGLKIRAQAALQGMWEGLGRLKSYIETTYMPSTRTTYGVQGLPLGRDNYRACLKWHLSEDISPEQVHQTGLREVDRITQLMRQVMTKQSFSGTVSEYYTQLRADPQFQLGSRAEIIKAYEDLIFNKIYPKLPPLFKDIPNSHIVVKPSSYDGAYGMYLSGSEDGSRPGTFYVNLFRPNETRTFSMVSLTLHEAVPGHHLQSIYQLAAELPKFQKYMDYIIYPVPYHFPLYTAYVEGWALYSEYLGEEMGVYANDYEMMGRYGDEIFRACRLVIDTGLHYKGWSRDKAIQYLRERTPMSPAEVEIEIDRYITWPGQACAYKIGELKIKELRQNATRELGSKFDIRDFHSVLLTNGPVPLSVMENMVKDYIAGKLTGTAECIHCQTARSMGVYVFLAALMWIVAQQ